MGSNRTLEIETLQRWVPVEHRHEDGPPATEEKVDRRKFNGNAANLGKYNGHPPNGLSRKFRLAIRNLMTTEEIELLLRERIIGELKGKMRVKILPTILKIAAGQSFNSGGGKVDVGPLGGASIHVHLNAMSDPQLKDYYERGIVPDSMKQLVEMRKANEPHEPEESD
jgi:hypothetical protein